METSRFDSLFRLVAMSASRRGAVGIGLSLTLAVLGSSESGAKKRKKQCKKKCDPCEKCRRGKCKSSSPGKEACGGECLPVCPSSPELVTERNPLTCDCCAANGQSPGGNICLISAPCCSESCSSGTCIALEQGAACDFDAQCESRDCASGECA